MKHDFLMDAPGTGTCTRLVQPFRGRLARLLWLAGSVVVPHAAIAVDSLASGAADPPLLTSAATSSQASWPSANGRNTAVATPSGSAAADIELDAILAGPSGTAAGDSAPSDRLGERVAIAGDTLLVSAPRDDVASAAGAGSVYVFRRSAGGWQQAAKLVASDPQALANFGQALAWDGQRAVVGAPKADGGRGKVYVFERSHDDWTQQASIPAPSPAGMSIGAFGASVALSATRLMVGANLSTNGSGSSGSVHALVLSNGEWLPEAMLTAPTGDSFLQFGSTVALGGEHAIIGSVASAGGAAATAHAFWRDNNGQWIATGTLLPAESVPAEALYASAIAMSADRAVIGAPRAGAAYVFRRKGAAWLPDGELRGQTGFGNALALAGNQLLIGSFLIEGVAEASAFLFDYVDGTWVERAAWAEGVSGWLDSFGISVALDTDTAVVGAPGGNFENGGARGEVKVFEHADSEWAPTDVVRVAPGPQGYFGRAVAVAGPVVMVGSPGDDIEGRRSQGSVRWMQRVGMRWSERARIVASLGWEFQLFGTSLALDGDRLLIGASGLNPTATEWQRTAYLFAREGAHWVQQSDLTLPPTRHDSRFGATSLLASNAAIIGASSEQVEGASVGAVHVFVELEAGWSLQQTLTAPDAQHGSGFGESLALHQDLLMIGAPRHEHGHLSNARGAVYFFRRIGDQWQFESMIDVPAQAADATFGSAAQLDENYVYVGAPTYAVPPAAIQRSGEVYAYPRVGQGWGEPVVITPVSARIEPRFGQTMTATATQLVVGAPFVIGAPITGEGWDTTGTVFVFRPDAGSWLQSHRLTAAESDPHIQRLGEVLAADSSTLLIGAPQSAGPPPYGNPSEGAVLVFGDGSLRFADGFER